MRSRLFLGLVAAVLGVAGACGRAPAPGENTATSVLPPITVCYEPDGEPCPPPDAGEEGGADGGGDSGAAIDATVLDARADGAG